jgi:hypothetical protein
VSRVAAGTRQPPLRAPNIARTAPARDLLSRVARNRPIREDNRMKTALLLLLVLTSVACNRDGAGTGLADDRFVDVVVELRRASLESQGDPATFAARREAILREASVTEEQLRGYVEAHGRDIDHMAEIWDSINARLSAPAPPE